MLLKKIKIVFWIGLLFLACSTTESSDRRQLMLVSDAQMNQLGDEAFREILGQYKESKNEGLTQEIKTIGENLARASGKNFAWEFKLLESEEMNAFCLPGGKIAVFTGLLKATPTNASVAAVVGHEIAHAILRHGGERMSQGLLAQGIMEVASVTLGEQKYKALILQALGIGVNVGVMLPYSRSHESEADHLGTIYMAKAGYDPNAAVEVWRKMAELQQGQSQLELLSTHPDPLTRIQNLTKKMPEYLSQRGAQIATKPL